MLGWLKAGREPMAKVDTAWLRMERPTNLMMITGVIMFPDRIDIERLRGVISDRFLSFKRFNQKAIDTSNGAFWEFDPDFDLSAHVRVTALPGKAGKRELEDLASELASTPLDQSKPLWQFHVVENYRGGTALISRIHHCYADGLALVQVMLSLTDVVANPSDLKNPEKGQLSLQGGTVFNRLERMARKNVDRAMKLSLKAMEKSMDMLRDPQTAQMVARDGGEIAAELAHALTLSDDPQTVFRGRLGVRKRVAWAEPLPLQDVKAVAKSLGATVNDFLIACMTGALRHYLVQHHGEEQVDGLTIRATVPVNLRPLEHAKNLGNHFGLVFLDLPVGECTPYGRLRQVRANMIALKQSKQAAVSFGLLAALGMGPSFLQKPALELFSRKATAVMTNVPGPQTPLYLAGSMVEEMMFWVPQTGSIGTGLSILSYNDQVYVGLITDQRLVPDPGTVLDRFAIEFENLVLLRLMTDWECVPDLSDVDALLHE